MSGKAKAICYMIFSSGSFAFMNAFVRLAGDMPSVEKSFFRNLVAAFVALAILLREGQGFAIKKGTLPFHLGRSILGTIGILCNFYAVDHLVLSNASMLNKMSPFFVLVFSFLFLKEKLTHFQVGAVLTAFVGTLFVIQPTFENLNLGPSLIGLTSGLAAGGAYTMVPGAGAEGGAQSGDRVLLLHLLLPVGGALVGVPLPTSDSSPIPHAPRRRCGGHRGTIWGDAGLYPCSGAGSVGV